MQKSFNITFNFFKGEIRGLFGIRVGFLRTASKMSVLNQSKLTWKQEIYCHRPIMNNKNTKSMYFIKTHFLSNVWTEGSSTFLNCLERKLKKKRFAMFTKTNSLEDKNATYLLKICSRWSKQSVEFLLKQKPRSINGFLETVANLKPKLSKSQSLKLRKAKKANDN